MPPRGPQAGPHAGAPTRQGHRKPVWSASHCHCPWMEARGRGSSERSPQRAAPDGGDAGVCPGAPAPACAGDGPAKGLPAKASSDPGLNGANLARPLHLHSVRRSRCHQSRRSQSAAGRRGGDLPPESGPPDGKEDAALNLTEPDEVRGNWAVGARSTSDRKTGPPTHTRRRKHWSDRCTRTRPQARVTAGLTCGHYSSSLLSGAWTWCPVPGKCHFLLVGTCHMQKCQLAQ